MDAAVCASERGMRNIWQSVLAHALLCCVAVRKCLNIKRWITHGQKERLCECEGMRRPLTVSAITA